MSIDSHYSLQSSLILVLTLVSSPLLAHDQNGSIGQAGSNRPIIALELLAEYRLLRKDLMGPGSLETPRAIVSKPCVDGYADIFACDGVDLLSNLPNSEMGSGFGNDLWGWTDPESGREYALMGKSTGTAFVDISDPENPVYLGQLPTESVHSSWRDIKTYQNHAFIVADNTGFHGLQVFDLTVLRQPVETPMTFRAQTTFRTFGDAHNVVINEQAGVLYAVGGERCDGGLLMIDIQAPLAPRMLGCHRQDGYTHDAQCVRYQGPDSSYQGHDLCLASNGDHIAIIDVTEPNATSTISVSQYPGLAFAHQGWLTEDQRYFLSDDEIDEMSFGHNARSYIWDLQDLQRPELIGVYESTLPAIDHNLYVRGEFIFQANYTSGLRILESSDIANGQLREVAFFDTFPRNDNPFFSGAWSVYPFFASGNIIVSDINRGLFVLSAPITQPEPLEKYQIDASSSGLWFNADQSGHGLSITVIDTAQGQRVLVYWFVFKDGQQLWLGGLGEISDNQADILLEVTTGAQFPPDFDPLDVEPSPWGTLHLLFADDDHLSASWTPDLEGFEPGQLEMERLSRISSDDPATACLSGIWFNQQQSGHGVLTEVIDSDDGPLLLMTWYVYSEGRQAWLQGIGPLSDQSAELRMSLPLGADFPPAFEAESVAFEDWGNLTVQFGNPQQLTLQWSSNLAGFSSDMLSMQIVARPAGLGCSD